MKTTKVLDSFTSYGFGFPVVLQNVSMICVRGVWAPDANYNELSRKVALMLACACVRLTGNQVKFILNFFGMTHEDFGKYFDVSHPVEWGEYGDGMPPIRWSLERDLRLFIMDRLDETAEAIGELYRGLRSRVRIPCDCEPVFVDMAK